MRVSEAILLGSTMSPQAFQILKTSDGSTCAVGAAMAAIGELDDALRTVDACQFWSWLFNRVVCPECHTLSGVESIACYVITHLNDTHKWTREQIAEWVATIEPQEETKTEIGIKEEEPVCV